MNDKVMSVTMVTNYIKKLNSGSSPDGIRAEYLKRAFALELSDISVSCFLCVLNTVFYLIHSVKA